MSSSSADETENEDKEEKMKQLAKLKIRRRKKRKSRQMKKRKTNMPMFSMSSTELRRISNSKSEERPKNLKELLIEYLKENKYMEDIKAKLEIKEEQKIEERRHKSNNDRSKVHIKGRPKTKNEKQNIPLQRKPLKKRNKKGIDRNGNMLRNNRNVASMVVQPKIQPKLDIDLIVEKCANDFKASIKSAIVEFANAVIKPDSVNNDGIDKSQSKQSEPFESTNDEILTPYSDTSTECENSDVTQHEDFETQEKNFFKISLEKEKNNLYRIDKERFQESRLKEKNKLDKYLGKVTDKKWDKLIEKRYQNLEMGRKIFENAYRFYENNDDDENNEFEQNQIIGAEDVVFKRRRNIPLRNLKRSEKTVKTFVPSREKKTEAENLGLYVNVDMVHPRDIYLSSLPQYSEYRTEVHVPKSCIEDNHTTVDHSEQSDNEDMSSQTSDEEIGEEKSQLSVGRHVAEFSVKSEVFSDETTKNIKTEYTDEGPTESKLNVMETFITDYISSIRKKFESDLNGENKNKYTVMKKSYQDLERERIKCQKRINRELEYFKRPTEQKYSAISSTKEYTDDEALEKSKKTITEISGRAKKRKYHETKRSTSPIFVYHYYRPNYNFNANKTFYDSDGSVSNSETNIPFYHRRQLRTPPPIGTSNYEATEQISEERKSIRRSVDCLPSTSENGENVIKQSEMEDETQNSKLKTCDKLKIHYQPMKITFDARSITNSKS